MSTIQATNLCHPDLLVCSVGSRLLLQNWLGDLPDELLCGILKLSWSLDSRERTPAEEVRCALQLRSVCQRVGRLLRAQPLPLHLDFSWPLGSSTRFQEKHLLWLASAAQRDSVASLTLPLWDMSWGPFNARRCLCQTNYLYWLWLATSGGR